MGSYMHSWKLFRVMSNENKVTADHLLSRPFWPRNEDLVLVDVGCGDGRLTEQIVLGHGRCRLVSEVRLLDPDPEFLAEARQHLTETGIVTNVNTFLGPAEDNLARHYSGSNVILAVHVVYLMQDGAFETMLDALPPGVPMYVVLDTPYSVFTTLWKNTAPKYYERSRKTHETIKHLAADKYSTDYTTISSRIDNPLHIPHEIVRNSILSMLCYSEVGSMPAEQREWVETQVAAKAVGEHIRCESACYEITKLT